MQKIKKIPRYVAIPGTCYEGTVYLRSPQSLSPFQKILLKYIYDEPDLQKIFDSFNLNARIIQNALVELFYLGLIYIDFNSGLVTLAEEIQKYIEDRKLDDYQKSSAPEARRIKFIQEGISGGLLSYRKFQDCLSQPLEKVDMEYLNPSYGGSFTPLQQMSPMTLIKAALDQFQPNNDELQQDLLDRVERIADIRIFQTRKMYFRIKTMRMEDVQKNFDAPIAPNVPPRILSCWIQKLNKNDIYETPVVEDFDILDNTCAYRLNSLFKKCQTEIKVVLNPSTQKSRKDLEYKIDAIEKLIDFLVSKGLSYCTSIDTVETLPAQPCSLLPILKNTISKTSNLLVLGSAFVSPNWMRVFGDTIAELLKTGIKVILLYGFPPENTPVNLIDKELENIRNQFFDQFAISPKDIQNLQVLYGSPKFHSKFCIIDTSAAFLGSLNFLSSSFQDSPKESVIFLEGGDIPRLLLEYALEHLPDFPAARKWCEGLAQASIAPKLSKKRLVLCDSYKNEGRTLIQQMETWRETPTKEIRDKINITLLNIQNFLNEVLVLPSATLIREMDHRDFMRKGLRDAKKQAVIATDRIHPRTFSAGLHMWFNSALERNIQVLVLWGRETADNPSDPSFQQSIDTIKLLKTQVNAGLVLSDKPAGSHAKFCLIDDVVAVVTSFNFLSVGGVPQMERTLSGELGLVLNSQDIVSKLATQFGLKKSKNPAPKAKEIIKKETTPQQHNMYGNIRYFDRKRNFGVIDSEKKSYLFFPWGLINTSFLENPESLQNASVSFVLINNTDPQKKEPLATNILMEENDKRGKVFQDPDNGGDNTADGVSTKKSPPGKDFLKHEQNWAVKTSRWTVRPLTHKEWEVLLETIEQCIKKGEGTPHQGELWLILTFLDRLRSKDLFGVASSVFTQALDHLVNQKVLIYKEKDVYALPSDFADRKEQFLISLPKNSEISDNDLL